MSMGTLCTTKKAPHIWAWGHLALAIRLANLSMDELCRRVHRLSAEFLCDMKKDQVVGTFRLFLKAIGEDAPGPYEGPRVTKLSEKIAGEKENNNSEYFSVCAQHNVGESIKFWMQNSDNHRLSHVAQAQL